MTKKINVITIEQNKILEIPNDNIEIDNQEIKPYDTTEKHELDQEIVEIVESQDVIQDLTEPVVKSRKPRVKKEKIIPTTINDEPEEIKQDECDMKQPIEVSDVLNVKTRIDREGSKVITTR